MIRKQVGHAATNVTDLYSHQDEAFVRTEMERVGLNFSLESLRANNTYALREM